MKILIAVDAFKGSASAERVARSIKRGIYAVDPKIDIACHPLADGGEGSLSVLHEHMGLEMVAAEASDPLGRPLHVSYGRRGSEAYIELAAASGLTLLKPEERRAMRTTSLGSGTMIHQAIESGASHVYLFLGGSATNDAGMGIAHALGYRFLDADGRALHPIGAHLMRVARIDPTMRIPGLDDVAFTLLCDVENPMVGPSGAAHVYAAQKGATHTEIEQLDMGLRQFAHMVRQQLGLDIGAISGGGAAGGIGAGLHGLLRARLARGADMIMAWTDFDRHVAEADVIISGEGRLDHQTRSGKLVQVVCQRAALHRKAITLFVGQNEWTAADMADSGVRNIQSIVDAARPNEDPIDDVEIILERMAGVWWRGRQTK